MRLDDIPESENVEDVRGGRGKLLVGGGLGTLVVIILGLAGAVFSLSASLQWMGMKTVLGVDYRVAVRALVILVLAFTAHTIYQQVKLRKLRRELKDQHVQAEVFRRLAMFDPLTGLCNRRFAEQRLKAEIARSERRGTR
jgi:predicted signal transduction protein with EAL and GGDEF domain